MYCSECCFGVQTSIVMLLGLVKVQQWEGLINETINVNSWMVLKSVASWLTIRSTSRKPTARKFVNARYFNLTSPQTWPINVSTKRDQRKLWKPASCCEDLMSYIINSLMLYQPCATLTYASSQKLMDHLSILIHILTHTSTFQPLGKKNNNR